MHYARFLVLIFIDPAHTNIYTLPYTTLFRSDSIAAPSAGNCGWHRRRRIRFSARQLANAGRASATRRARDRKSTRLNSSHANISYAVFCLKKKKKKKKNLKKVNMSVNKRVIK